MMEIVTDNSKVIAELQRQNDELVAMVGRLEGLANSFPCWYAPEFCHQASLPDKGVLFEIADVLKETPTQSLHHIEASGVEKLKFPTMLRKMWSGSEVQEWIKEQAEQLRQQSTNEGSDGDE